MRTSALARLGAVLVAASCFLASPAAADDADLPPVAVDDTVMLWPGQWQDLNVLANDSDPGGDDLDVCRLPPPFSATQPDPPISAYDRTRFDDVPAGTLRVLASRDARGTHAISYYVCNHSRLAPAKLTVIIRPVAPVDVVAVRGRPGTIRVRNHNDRQVVMMVTDRAGCRVDVRAKVGAHATRTFRVRRHTVAWTAIIGNDGARGVADHGTIRGIKLSRPAAPPSEPGTICSWI